MISSLSKIARSWAIVFILANLLNILAPTISWALTSRPTAPEATSFEPVDTTDMVNLAKGDFAFNISVLKYEALREDIHYQFLTMPGDSPMMMQVGRFRVDVGADGNPKTMTGTGGEQGQNIEPSLNFILNLISIF